tara:strand:+ start:4193 stop:5872 length:1680 start_codon:yes stop_codon:yes gene_type:complete
MATQLQIRRGTSTQVAAFTGAEGEIVVNTTNDSVHVNDGSTQGGFELARVDGSNWAITNNITTTANISVGSITSTGISVSGAISATGDLTLSSAGPGITLTDTDNNPDYQIKNGNGSFRIIDTTASQDRININSSAHVGINNTAPEYALDVDDDTGNAYIAINRATQSQGEVGLKLDGGTSGGDWFIYQKTGGDDLNFYRGSDLVTIKTDGKFGVGTTTPDTLVELVGADPILTIRDSSTSSASGIATLRLAETGASDSLDQYFDIRANAGKLEIVDNWNEGGGTGTRVTLDDSGNLLIGLTSTTIPGIGNTTAGVSIRGDDGSFFSRALGSSDTNNVVSINRSTADGHVVGIQQDGVDVGRIGTAFDSIYIGGNGDGAIYFNGVSDVRPWNKSTQANLSGMDLGSATARWDNLYLSGGVYLGGTGSANYLDDYEEGSFTPALNGFTGTYVHQIGQYRKVGGLVTAAIHIHISSTGGSGAIIVTGLPFTQTSTNRYGGATALHCNVWATSTKPDNVLVNPGTTTAPFYRSQGQTGIAVPQLSDMGTGNILCVFVYMTAQ